MVMLLHTTSWSSHAREKHKHAVLGGIALKCMSSVLQLDAR